MLYKQQKSLYLVAIIMAMVLISNQTQYDVIVVGGGIAGITAAHFLAQEDYEVVVVQASGSLGGRLKTTTISLNDGSNFNFDQGASWIHGYSPSNPIRNLSQNIQGVELIKTDDDSTEVYDESGNDVNSQAQQYQNRFYTFVEDQASQYDYSTTMQEAIQLVNSSLRSNKYFMYHIGTNLEFETSGTIDQLSAVWDDNTFTGDQMLVVSGYQKFAEELASGFKILLNHKVVKISYKNQKNTVQFDDGSKIYAKDIIIAVPLGVLKAQSIQFEPQLPNWKKEAIQSLGFGNVCKILLTFDSIDFLNIDSHFIGITSSDVQERGLATYFLNLYELAGIPALMTFGLGPNSDQIENMAESDLKDILAQRLTSISERQVLSSEFQIYRSSWRNNQNVQGAYSFASYETKQDTWEKMKNPISANNWYFCGQHTNSQYRGTVHGAYISGKNVASSISSTTNSIPNILLQYCYLVLFIYAYSLMG